MKESILMHFDTINDAICESEIAVAEALLVEYDKALTILEYSDIEPEQLGIFQEGKIMDDVKKQGEGQSKIMKIISFIPRLIAALFKAITGKLQTAAKSAKNVIENTKGKDHNKMEKFIEGIKNGDNKTAKKWLVALGVNAAIAGGFGLAKAHKYRDSKKPIQLQYSYLIKNGLSEEDAKKFNEYDKIMEDIYLSIHDDHDRITKPVPPETVEKFEKAYNKSIELFKKISVHKCMKVMRVSNIKFTQKELSDRLNRMADCLTDMIRSSNDESAKNLQNTSDESFKQKIDDLDQGIENTKNKINEIVKENEKELEKVDDKSEVNDEPANDPGKEMGNVIDELIKQYADFQNTGDVKFIKFKYFDGEGLVVFYNSSILFMDDAFAEMVYNIIENPNKLDGFKSFYNSYSDAINTFTNSKYKAIAAAITACTANNIKPEFIRKDKSIIISNINRESNIEILESNANVNLLNSLYDKKKNDPDFNNNSEAVKAIETLANIFKQINSEVMTYMSELTEIITKLETIFGYNKMWTHAD